jgi:ribosomal protein S27AE
MENEEQPSEKYIELIRERIKNKVGKLVCPICGETKFIFIKSGYDYTAIFEDEHIPKSPKLAKPPRMMIPSVVMVCDNCGFMSQHSTRILRGDGK